MTCAMRYQNKDFEEVSKWQASGQWKELSNNSEVFLNWKCLLHELVSSPSPNIFKQWLDDLFMGLP